METMQPEQGMDAAPARRMTQRQEDGLVYKLMAFVVFALIGLPIGYMLTSRTGVPGAIRVLVGIFIFDAGWDLVILASGRDDLLKDGSARRIIGKALERTTPTGFVLLFFLLKGDALDLVVLLFVISGVAPLLVARR